MNPKVSKTYRLVTVVFENYILIPEIFKNYSLVLLVSENVILVPRITKNYSFVLRISDFERLVPQVSIFFVYFSLSFLCIRDSSVWSKLYNFIIYISWGGVKVF